MTKYFHLHKVDNNDIIYAECIYHVYNFIYLNSKMLIKRNWFLWFGIMKYSLNGKT